MGKLYLSPSLIAKQEMCEYQIYLERVDKQKRLMTMQMASGLSGHRVLEEEFKKDAVEVSFEEFLKEGGSTRELRLVSEQHLLRGIIDELVITKDRVFIFDDKKNAKPYPSYIKQLHSYGLLVQELVDNKPIFLAIRDLETGLVVWSDEFKTEHKKSILDTMERVRGIIEGRIEPITTQNPRICAACSLNCTKRLIGFNS